MPPASIWVIQLGSEPFAKGAAPASVAGSTRRKVQQSVNARPRRAPCACGDLVGRCLCMGWRESRRPGAASNVAPRGEKESRSQGRPRPGKGPSGELAGPYPRNGPGARGAPALATGAELAKSRTMRTPAFLLVGLLSARLSLAQGAADPNLWLEDGGGRGGAGAARRPPAFRLVGLLSARLSLAQGPAAPNLWLEDVDGARALDWVRGQNAIAQRELEASPDFKAIHERLLAIYDSKERI